MVTGFGHSLLRYFSHCCAAHDPAERLHLMSAACSRSYSCVSGVLSLSGLLLILGPDLPFHNEIWVLRSPIVIEPLPVLFDFNAFGM